MKNWLKVLLAVVLVLTCMLTYVACGNGSAGGNDNNNNGGNTQTPGGDNTGNNVTPGGSGDSGNEDNESSDEFEIPEDAWRVKFVYSYTAQIVNDNDRTQNKKESVTVATIYVDQENNGWTADLLAKNDAITYKHDGQCCCSARIR